MTDGTVDSDFAALERAESLKVSEVAARPRERRSVLAVLPERPDAPVRTVLAEEAADDAAVVAVPADEPRADPVVRLQTARMGFAFAAILVLYWLWIRKRRRH